MNSEIENCAARLVEKILNRDLNIKSFSTETKGDRFPFVEVVIVPGKRPIDEVSFLFVKNDEGKCHLEEMVETKFCSTCPEPASVKEHLHFLISSEQFCALRESYDRWVLEQDSKELERKITRLGRYI